jgi:hypothetical protein
MSARSNDVNEEITAGNRPAPATNGEWNRQTIVDARNVLQTQQSNDSSHQTNEQRAGKSAFSEINFRFLYVKIFSC